MRRLEEITRALDCNQAMIRRLQQENRRIERRAEAVRGQMSEIVELAGGAMQLPGYERALYIKSILALDWDVARLAPWLKENAPQYCVEVRECRIDRDALRRALELRGGDLFLPDIARPVEGLAAREFRSLVVPAREDN